jgi:hypothetical protein
MSKKMQIYYNAVFGAIGGLLGWLVVGSFATGGWNITLAYAFVGSGVGLFIGGAVGAVEGAIVKRSFPRAVLGLIMGGVAGLVSGLLGLLIGEAGFLLLGGGIAGRSAGWTALGLFLGIGEGVVSRKLKQASYGAIGGIVGGFVGGVIYETMTQLFLEWSDTIQMIVGAMGLIIIGACLGSIIPMSVEVIARVVGKGTLVVKNGKRAGMEISVIDSVTLGSYDGCQVYLPGDKGIEPKHAEIFKRSDGFFITDLGSASGTFVGGQQVPPGGQGYRLSNGAEIRLGQTSVVFLER